MQRTNINIGEFTSRVFDLWDKRWFLLTAGDFAARRYNSMTVSWGGFGIMWNKPIAMTVVRPQRHTRQFTDDFDTFTLAAFPQALKPVLDLLGSKSGRDIDKISPAGLTPTASAKVASPSYAEAELVIECRKIYFQDYNPAHFLDPVIPTMYKGDYHRMYFGEIVAISGTEEFLRLT
jgi:flavin reductase (DIM6/NTAB) family NADH-FMN oxidoreductase RutF